MLSSSVRNRKLSTRLLLLVPLRCFYNILLSFCTKPWRAPRLAQPHRGRVRHQCALIERFKLGENLRVTELLRSSPVRAVNS